MSRGLAHHAKIIDGADDAFAKMMLPDAIDHHAREKQIGATEHALSEFQPSGTGGFNGLVAGDGFEESAMHLIAGRFVIAADEDALVDTRTIGGGDDTGWGGD